LPDRSPNGSVGWFSAGPLPSQDARKSDIRLIGLGPNTDIRRSPPYTITIANAAAPEKSLAFLFWGAGIFVLPVIAIYTAIVYWLFRGKLRKGYG
jgi:hypothetical protein